MQKFRLRGLAEGLIGVSVVTAKTVSDVLIMFPILQENSDKLRVRGNVISGFCPCDG